MNGLGFGLLINNVTLEASGTVGVAIVNAELNTPVPALEIDSALK